jgi:hypothetical protein
MLHILANHPTLPNAINFNHGGWARQDVSPTLWLFAVKVAHVAEARQFFNQQSAAAGYTVEVFPLPSSGKKISAAAMTALTSYLGTAPADQTSATVMEAVFVMTGDHWFSPEGL